ncbi:hypothetical protein [Geomonas sp.]|uniref:hypothetical protein n=1 Tax=Geomonas sp. TaxID=2651584 RepID=UPI002B47C137|nr:hypothetical protein [Geomonas sp.]HJV33819.1 hypothetical protein [Geomonas sp.]
MDAIFELILSFLWEIFANLLVQFLLELGLRSLAEPFRKSEQRHPVLAFIGCIMLGTLAGYLSLLVFPYQLFHAQHLQGYSLFFVPLASGLTMAGLRKLRERQEKPLLFMDSFTYGYTFAFFMTFVRSYNVW